MAQYSVQQAKIELPRLIADALAGEDVVIARGNVPVVRLVPVQQIGRRVFGALQELIKLDAQFDMPLPDDELGAWDTA